MRPGIGRRWFRLDGAGRPGDAALVVANRRGRGGQLLVEWNGTVVLTTPRLLLRTFRRDDLPLYAALNADPEVARYLGGR
jgi:RimJ/RimL family protein N-acetyltransferase